MKILFAVDNYNAHYYINLGLARAFTACGHECIMWDVNQKSKYDAFDDFEPDIFFGQTYNLDDGYIRLIDERPHLKVVMKAANWGNNDNNPYPVLRASEKEIEKTLRLFDLTRKPSLLFIHHEESSLNDTHGKWSDNGLKVISLLNAADTFVFYNGKFDERLACDGCFVGGYWGYKAQVLDKYLLQKKITDINSPYNIKIFGNSEWPSHLYCGHLKEELMKDLFFSSKVCFNLHEPHSQALGYDIIERPFKLLSSGACVLSDRVSGLERLFPDEICYADSPDDFYSKFEDLLKNDRHLEFKRHSQKRVLEKHTYFDRIAQIFKELDLSWEVDNVLETKKRYIK